MTEQYAAYEQVKRTIFWWTGASNVEVKFESELRMKSAMQWRSADVLGALVSRLCDFFDFCVSSVGTYE